MMSMAGLEDVGQYRKLLEVTAEERTELTRWAQSRTLPAGDVFRARIILGLAGTAGHAGHEEWALDFVSDGIESGRHMLTHAETPVMDWSDCPEVEVVPGKVSGVPILKHSRMPADAVIENYEGGSPVEEIAGNFDLPEDQIRAVLSYSVKRNPALQP